MCSCFTRNNNVFREIYGEKASVNDDDIVEWIVYLPEIVKNYELQDITNANKTDLLFGLNLDKILIIKTRNYSGGEEERRSRCLKMSAWLRLVWNGIPIRKLEWQVKFLQIEWKSSVRKWSSTATRECLNLKNAKLVFLSAKTYSTIHFLDQGVIVNFKLFYCRRNLTSLLARV